MFARASTIPLFAMLPLFAAATTTPTTPASQCITGNLQCCNSTQEASDFSLPGLETLGIIVSNPTGQLGFTCSPISVIGIPGNSCSAKPVCCANNSFKGIIALNCTPVDLNL